MWIIYSYTSLRLSTMGYCSNPIKKITIEYTETATTGDNSRDLFLGEDHIV